MNKINPIPASKINPRFRLAAIINNNQTTMINRNEVSKIYEFTRQVEFHGKQVGLVGRLILINADKRNASEEVHQKLMASLAYLCANQPVSTIAGIKFEIENQP